jgi:hypothetical protein
VEENTVLGESLTPRFWLEEYGIVVKEEKKIKKEKDEFVFEMQRVSFANVLK